MAWQEFKSHLDSFCREHQIVVGAPGVVFPGGEHGVVYGGLATCLQVPQRVWVGLRYIGGSAAKSGTAIRIARGNDGHRIMLPHFEEPRPFKQFRPPVGASDWKEKAGPLEGLIDGLLGRPACKDLLKLDGAAFELSILSELRSGAGCNFSGAFSAATIVAIHLAAAWLGNVECLAGTSGAEGVPGELRRLVRGDVRELLNDPTSWLHRINRAALVLESYLHGGSASGYGPLCALVPTHWPMLYLREAPTSVRIPARIPVGWDKLGNRQLTEAEWETLDRLLLDPVNGLQYRLGCFEWDHGLIPNAEAELPFVLATIYSGNPKDTGRRIEEVKALRKMIATGLRAELSFFLQGASLQSSFPGESPPAFFDVLEQLQSNELAESMRVPQAGIHWAGLMVPHALCRLLRSVSAGDASQGEQDAALRGFADAVRAAQGGLSQLLLVDPPAVRIAAQLQDAFRNWEAITACKYSGGSGGGNLIFVGPPSLDAARLRNSLSELRRGEDSRQEWEQPTLDYCSSEDDCPLREGTWICPPSAASRPARGELHHYKSRASGKWEGTVKKGVGEWCVLSLAAAQRKDRCIVDLDLRGPSGGRSRVFLGEQEVEQLKKGTTRGVEAIAHIVHVLLQKGGSASRSDLMRHAGEVKVKDIQMESYVSCGKVIRSLIVNPLGKEPGRREWFRIWCEELGNKDYKLNLGAGTSGAGEVWIFVRK